MTDPTPDPSSTPSDPPGRQTSAEELAAELVRTHRQFVEGYSSELVDATLGPLSWAVGVRLVVLWDYVDRWGTGGSSRLLARAGSRWREVSAALVDHLDGRAEPGALLEACTAAQRAGADLRTVLCDGTLTGPEQAAVAAGVPVGAHNIALVRYPDEAPRGA